MARVGTLGLEPNIACGADSGPPPYRPPALRLRVDHRLLALRAASDVPWRLPAHIGFHGAPTISTRHGVSPEMGTPIPTEMLIDARGADMADDAVKPFRPKNLS